MAGIENLRALKVDVEKEVDVAKKIMEDGKLDVKDVPNLPALYSATRDLISHLMGSKPEVADLDKDEYGVLFKDACDLALYVWDAF